MVDTTQIASFDFETGSYVDLKKTGAARYAEDVTTRMICLSTTIPRSTGTKHYVDDYLTGPHPDICDWIAEGGFVSGWNVMFEYWIWNKVLPRQYPHIKFPELKLNQLVDTMAIAAYNGLPLSLDKAGQALPELGINKDKDGHALMMRMNKPRDRKKGTWWHEDDPARLERLKDYCIQDVAVERAILNYLPDAPTREKLIWQMDADISLRGVFLDQALVDRMKATASEEITRLNEEMDLATGGDVTTTNQVAKILKWVGDHMVGSGYKAPTSLAKDRIASLLKRPNLPPPVRTVLELRQEAAKSSVAKLTAMETMVCRDGRIRGLTQYYGAFRTGRDAGRGIQVQNFPRSLVKDQIGLVKYIKAGGDHDGFLMFFGVTAMTGLSSALRGCLSASPNKHFCAIDFSQIEARVLPWLAGDFKKLQVFIDGEDVYVVAASGIYSVPKDQVTGAMRQEGKVSELALGYGGGVGAFHSMAKVYGLEVTDERADELKVAWRRANKKIVNFWYALERAALDAIRNPGDIFACGYRDMIRFQLRDGHLWIKLPAGRELCLREACIEQGAYGDQVTYMDLDQYTQQWKRVHTYGGQLSAFVTQGTARDVLKEANYRLWKWGYDLIASIHDETIMDLDDPEDYEAVERIFNTNPRWAVDLPIGADGYVSDRFRKG